MSESRILVLPQFDLDYRVTNGSRRIAYNSSHAGHIGADVVICVSVDLSALFITIHVRQCLDVRTLSTLNPHTQHSVQFRFLFIRYTPMCMDV